MDDWRPEESLGNRLEGEGEKWDGGEELEEVRGGDRKGRLFI